MLGTIGKFSVFTRQGPGRVADTVLRNDLTDTAHDRGTICRRHGMGLYML